MCNTIKSHLFPRVVTFYKDLTLVGSVQDLFQQITEVHPVKGECERTISGGHQMAWGWVMGGGFLKGSYTE